MAVSKSLVLFFAVLAVAAAARVKKQAEDDGSYFPGKYEPLPAPAAPVAPVGYPYLGAYPYSAPIGYPYAGVPLGYPYAAPVAPAAPAPVAPIAPVPAVPAEDDGSYFAGKYGKEE